MPTNQFMSGVSIFKGLGAEAIEKVSRLITIREYKKGEEIIREGETGNNFFIVIKGSVAVNKNVAGGRRRNLANLAPGEVFGELAIFDTEPRSANAEAIDETSVAIFQVDEFKSLLEQDRTLALTIQDRIIKVLCERLRNTDNLLNEGVIWGFTTAT